MSAGSAGLASRAGVAVIVALIAVGVVVYVGTRGSSTASSSTETPAEVDRPPRVGAAVDIVTVGQHHQASPALLAAAKEQFPRLPFDRLDVLAIQMIGKEISAEATPSLL